MTAPKPAELHVHLLGAIPPGVLHELARRHRVALPPVLVGGVRPGFRYRDFDHFMELMRSQRPLIRDPEDMELITDGFSAELAGQGVRYAEVMVTPSSLETRGLAFPSWFEAMNRSRARARAQLGLELRWIVDVNRAQLEPDRAYWADHALEVAIAGRDAGVVALGLDGAEAGNPPEPFAPWFEKARAAGLHSVPHAGEMAGPASIWGAVRALHAERIAHGVRAVEDPALVAHLAERRIALDLCPASNVALGVYPSLAGHPLRRLHESGVPVTVNSDDPTMFGTTLSAEVAALSGPMGLDEDAVSQIIANSWEFAFDPSPSPLEGGGGGERQ